ncbi:MAG: hypothetical protein JSW43_03875 [Gemmatimonadota bacterium]|nr:MAG: hypothetical protein JSW43_03875 [Gemmatimonadota bacterium]
MGRLIVLVPLLAAVAALSARNRMLSIVILFGYLTLEGLFKLLSGYHPVVHIGTDIVLWMLVAVWAATALLQGHARLPRVPFFIILVLHVVWVLLLVFSPYTASVFVGLASLKIHLSMIPLYFIGFMLAGREDAPRRFMRAITVLWVATFAITLVQYIGGPDSLFDLGEVYRRQASHYHEWRPFGTTGLPGGQAVFAMLALPFGLCLVLRGDYSLKNGWILATLIGSLAVFFVSGVRQVFLGCLVAVVGMVGLQIIRGRGRAATGAITVAALGAVTYIAVQEFVVPAAEESVARAANVPEIWRERSAIDRFQTLLDPDTYAKARAGGLGLIWDRVTETPLGVGLGRTGSAASALGDQLSRDPFNRMLQDRFGFQDNFYAAMLVETGVPGTLMLTTILVGLGLLAARLARTAPTREDAAFGSLVAGYMLAMIVMSWGSQPLLGNPTLAFFWFLGGMAAGRLRALERETAEARAASETTAAPDV